MSELTLYEAYIRAVRVRVQKYSDFLSSGKASSYEQYKEITGQIAGLKEALEELKQCAKKAGLYDDYD